MTHNRQLIIILDDKQSSLSSLISKYEEETRVICVEYFHKLISIFKKYKAKLADETDLSKLRNEFESKCNSAKIDQKIEELAVEGQCK